MRGVRVAAAMLLLGLVLGVGAGVVPVFAAKKAAPAAAECLKDSDCVLVPDGCCGCTEGGKQRAVAASKKESFERQRKKRCVQTVCAAVMSMDPSCSARAVCKRSTCVLGPP